MFFAVLENVRHAAFVLGRCLTDPRWRQEDVPLFDSLLNISESAQRRACSNALLYSNKRKHRILVMSANGKEARQRPVITYLVTLHTSSYVSDIALGSTTYFR